MSRTGSITVGTFNLASGRVADGRPSEAGQLADAVAALDLDVLAVQEVDCAQQRSGEVDQLAVVAAAVGAQAWRYLPTLTGLPGPGGGWSAALGPDIPQGPSYGIGLVSRWPVLTWRVRRFAASRAVLPLPLPGPGRFPRLLLVPDEPRAALAAVVATPLGPVTVVCAHLSFAPAVAAWQLRRIARWTAALPGPRVLAGDLNLPGRLPERLTGWTSVGRTPTYPVQGPRLQLDHVLVAPDAKDGQGARTRLRSMTALTLAPSPVSDHVPVAGRLVLERLDP